MYLKLKKMTEYKTKINQCQNMQIKIFKTNTNFDQK